MKTIGNKFKNSKGSALILVIFTMLMITAGVGIVSMQVNNQIISNKNRSNVSEQTYLAEAGVEKTITEIYKAIDARLINLEKNTEPKTNANSYIAYCLKESEKYFTRAKDNIPPGHKQYSTDTINTILSNVNSAMGKDEKLLDITNDIQPIIDNTTKLKGENWYKGVGKNNKKGIDYNVDMGMYYAELAKGELSHIRNIDSHRSTLHTKGSSQSGEDRILYLSQAELNDITNLLLKFRNEKVANDNFISLSEFNESPSERDSEYNQQSLFNYIDILNRELTLSNINSGNVKLKYILDKLAEIKRIVNVYLKPQGNSKKPDISPINNMETKLKESTTYLSNKELLDKTIEYLSISSTKIGAFEESPAKNKIVEESQIISYIETDIKGDIKKLEGKLNPSNTSDLNNLILNINNILDKLVKLQADIGNLKLKGNQDVPRVSEIYDVEKYLIEIKCNLGVPNTYINENRTITGRFELPPETYDRITIPGGEYKINEKPAYITDAVTLDIIVIKDRYIYNNNSNDYVDIIREVRPITSDIVARDYSKKSGIQANVTFYITEFNGGKTFKVYDHKVNSWEEK